jgi:adenosylcobyric acid synthase
VPYFADAYKLPPEDALGLPTTEGRSKGVKIAVLAYPRIANFDDFDPLKIEAGVDLVFVRPGEPVPGDCALVILPGSKATIADLASLREAGWDFDLKAHVRRGGHVLGICGGYQMLGRKVADFEGIEGPPSSVEGLGLLEIETVLGGDKILVETTGETIAEKIPFKGYEIHIGRTTGATRPLLRLESGKAEGAVSESGRVSGCYIHGLLTDDRQRRHWLQRVGAPTSNLSYDAEIEATLDLLADHLEKYIDCDALLALAREPVITTAG